MKLTLNHNPILHVRFEGRSLEVPLRQVFLDEGADDLEVKRAVARFLEVSEPRLRDYVVDRHETGNLTIRPQAVFG